MANNNNTSTATQEKTTSSIDRLKEIYTAMPASKREHYAGLVQNVLAKSAGSYQNNYNNLVKSYQAENGISGFRSQQDTASFRDRTTASAERLRSQREQYTKLMDIFGNDMDEGFRSQFSDMLNGTGAATSQILDYANNRHDFYSQFKDEDEYKTYNDMMEHYTAAQKAGQNTMQWYDAAKQRKDEAYDRYNKLKDSTGSQTYWDAMDAYNALETEKERYLNTPGLTTEERDAYLADYEKRRRAAMDAIDAAQAGDKKAAEDAARAYRDATLDYNYAEAMRYGDLKTDAKSVEVGKTQYDLDYEEYQKKVAEERAQKEADYYNMPGAGGAGAGAMYVESPIDTYRWEDSYRRPRDDWTEEQKNRFYSIYANDKDAAFEYAIKLNKGYNEQAREKAKQDSAVYQWMERREGDPLHNILSGAAGYALGVVTAPEKLGEFLDMSQELAGRGVVMNAPTGNLGDLADAMIERRASELNDLGTKNIPLIGEHGWGDVYQLGESIAQSMSYRAIGGEYGAALSSVVFFGTAAKEGLETALANGADPNRAWWYAVWAGANEALFEYFSVEKLIKMKDGKTLSQFLKNLLVQAGVEGSEELNTTLANTIAQSIVLGDKSELNLNIQKYVESGMSYEDAKKLAWKEWTEGLFSDFIGGAISGGISGGMEQVGGYAKAAVTPYTQNRASQYQKAGLNAEAAQSAALSDRQSLLDAAAGLKGTDAAAYGNRLQQRTQETNRRGQAKDITVRQAQKLVDMLTASDIANTTRAVQGRLAQFGITDEKLAQAITATALQSEAERIGARGFGVTKEQRAMVQDSGVAKVILSEMDVQNLRNEQKAYALRNALEDSGASQEELDSLTDPFYRGNEWVKKMKANKALAADVYGSQADITQEEINSVTVDGKEAKIVGKNNGKILVEQDGKVKAVGIGSLGNMSRGVEMLLQAAPTGDSGAAFLRLYKSGQNVGEYAQAWYTAQEMYGAQTSLSFDEVRAKPSMKALTDNQLRAALEIGRKSYDASKATAEERGKAFREAREKAAKSGAEQRKRGTVSLNGGEYNGRKYKGVSERNLTDAQKHVLAMVRGMADVVNINFAVYDGDPNEGGSYIKGGTVMININSGKYAGKIIGAASLAHEMTHFIQEFAPEEYQALKDFIVSEILKKSEPEFNRLVQIQMDLDPGITKEEAVDELIANACQKMLLNSKAIERLARKNLTVAEKIRNWIGDMRKKFSKAYEEVDLDDGLAVYEAARAIDDFMEQVQDAWDKGLEAAAENVSAAKATGMKTEINAGSTALEYDAKTESINEQRQLLTWEASDYVTERNKAAKEIADKLGISQKKARDYIDSVNSVAKYIAENKGRLDYEDTGRSPFVSNVEYGGSFDFTTLCKKRRLLTGTFSAIQNALKNTALTANEILEIRKMMDDAGLEVSCGKCYVEGSRASMGIFTKEFLKLYEKYNPGKWVPNMAQMNTPDGIEWVRNNHPEVYEQYEYFWNHYGTLRPGDPNLFASQQKPKLYQMRSAYKGEILQHFRNDSSIREKNKNGGIRFQSFSDFEIVHLLDAMQVIMDMSRVGLNGQAYTKVPDFAWALGKTGLKINLSIDAWDVVDGKLVFNNKEGMNFDEAMRIRDANSKNVGTICCVYDDAQLLAALADPRIDFIIPFHRSQWKKSQYKGMGLPATTKDYTYQQNEKWLDPSKHTHEYRGRQVKDKCTNYMPNEYWDFSKSGKENVEEYLRMCARDGKRPKFYKFLTNNGDGSYSLKADGSTDGYWKLLIDFKMYDNEGNGSPQMPVRPDFNMNEIMRMLESYEGGHNTFPVAHGVVNEFVSKYKAEHKGQQFQKLGVRADGIEVYETSQATKSLTWSQRKHQFLDLMANDYRGRTARFIRNGHAYYATFQPEDVKKNIYGDKKSDQAGKDAKVNAGADGDIFDLVENARYVGSAPETGKQNSAHRGIRYWDYFVKTVQIDGKVFDLVANVRKKATGEYVYSLQLNENPNVKAASPQTLPNNRGVQIGVPTASTDKVPQSETLVKNPNAKFMPGQQFQKLSTVEEEAVNHFGTTDNFRTAGYMLRDGRMLDFSGAHWLEGYDDKYIADWRKKNDIRQVDHEDVFEAYEAVGEDFPSDSSLDFMKHGNIRMVPESPGIELYYKSEPTDEQYRQIKAFVREVASDNRHYNSERFTVDLTRDRTRRAGTLSYTGTINADRVVNDIKHYYQTGEVRQQGLSQFYQKLGIGETAAERQARKDSFDNLKAENKILRERAEYWKAQTKLTKENTVRQQDTDRLANELLRKYNSKADREDIKAAVKELGDWLVQTEELDYDELKAKAEAIAEDIISGNYTLLDNSQQEQLDRLKDYLKSTPVNLTKSDFNDTGDEGFRKKYGRYFTVSENGRTIDSLWGEMAAMFGEGIFPEDTYAPGDMLNMIADYLDLWKPQYGNEFEMFHDEAVDAAANELIDAILSEEVRQTPGTFADKAQQKLNAQIVKDRAKLDALREAKNARIAELQRQAAEKNKQIRLAEKALKYEAVSKVKKHYQDMIKKQRNKRSDTSVRGKIRALHKELTDILLKPKEGRYVPKELVKATAEILGAIDTTSGRAIKAKAAFAELKVKYEELAKNDKYALAYDETISDMIQSLTESMGDGSIYDLTGAELENVYDVLKALKHTIVTANKLVGSKIEADAFDAANQWMREIENAKGIPTKALRKFVMAQMTPSSFFRMAGGYVKDSMSEQLFNELNNGQLTQTQILMEGGMIFRELIDDKKNMEKLHDKKNLVDIGLKDDMGNTVKITRGMMLSVYMHLLNEQNAKHVAYGGFTVPKLREYYANKMKDAFSGKTGRAVAFAAEIAELNEQLKNAESVEEQEEIKDKLADLQDQTDAYMSNLRSQIEEQLTEYDRKWIAAAQEFFDVFSKNKLNEVTEMVYGFSKARVDGYFPIHTDPNYRAASFDTIARDMSLENAGFMKERVNGANPILLEDITDVISSQLRRTAQYVGLMPAIRNFNKVYGKARAGYTMSVQSAMNRTFENEGKNYIENLLADLNGARHQDADIFDMLRGNMAGSVLTLNPRVALSQTASYPTAAAEIGYKPLIKALKDIKNNPSWSETARDEVAKWTPLWWYRMQGFSTVELGDIKNNEQFMSKVMDKMKWATGWIQFMDGMTTGALWQASKYYVDDNFSDLEKGSDEYMMKVAEVYNRVIEKTQPDYTTMQRPDILRNPNKLYKQLTMFMTQRLQNMNILYDAAATYSHYASDLRAGRNDVTAADVKQARTRLVWAASSQVAASATIVIFKALADFIMHNLNAYRDDDDELTAESVSKTLLANFAETIISNMLWGSELYSALKSIVTGDRYYGISLNGVDTFKDLLEDGVKTLSKVWKGDWENAAAPAWKLAKAVAQFFGVPLGNMEKIAKMSANYFEDAKNGTFMEAGVDRTRAQNTHILFDALQRGDTAKASRIRAEFKDKKDEQAALKGYIKEMYTGENQKINKAETVIYLQKYCGMTKRDAESLAQKWTMEVVTGIKYDDLKDDFLEGRVQMATAEKYLKAYGGYDAEEAAAKVNEWTCEKETGIAYSDIGNEVKTGRLSEEKAIRMLMKYGGKSEDAATKTVNGYAIEREYEIKPSELEEEYLAGNVDDREATDILLRYKYYGKENAAEKAAEELERMRFVKANPDAADMSITQVRNYKASGLSGVVSAADYLQAAKMMGTFSGEDKNGDGKTDRNSVVKQKLAYIDTLNITKEQKTALATALGISERTIRKYAAWRK